MSNIVTLENKERALELEVKMFELEQRRATALSKSAFFPDGMKGDVASAVIIYDLAQRMNASVMEIAQNIYIIYGRPSFSTAFIVARLNQSGKITGALKTVIADDKQSAFCEAIDTATGETLRGMTISMEIARAEGWLNKNGSKWKTMPELMLRKRAQSFFIREFYPEVLYGLHTDDEIVDTEATSAPVPADKKTDLNALLSEPVKKPTPERKTEVQPIDAELETEAEDAFGVAEKPKKPNMSILDNINPDGTDTEG